MIECVGLRKGRPVLSVMAGGEKERGEKKRLAEGR